MQREKGWHWVKRAPDEWEVAEWHGRDWYLSGNETALDDNDFIEIANRIAAPDEPKK